MGNFSAGLRQAFLTKVKRGSKLYFIFINGLYFVNKYVKILRKPCMGLIQRLPRRQFVIENSLGSFVVNAHDDTLPHSTPYFEKAYHDWLSQENPGVFVDIGANIGFYTILALRHHGFSKALVFEPNPEIQTILQENIRLNRLNWKVTNYQKTLGEKRKRVILTLNKFKTGLSSIKTEKGGNGDHKEMEVMLEPFDSLVDKKMISTITFVKIDVEGAEYGVLQGMRKTLEGVQKGTLLFIEILNSNHDKDKILSLLKDKGFSIKKQYKRNFLFEKQ